MDGVSGSTGAVLRSYLLRVILGGSAYFFSQETLQGHICLDRMPSQPLSYISQEFITLVQRSIRKKRLTTGVSSVIKLKHIRSHILLEAIQYWNVSFLGKGLMKGG